MSYNTPILFLVFNRPEKTQIIFDIIKKLKPKKLYISADGPRKNRIKDNLLCDQVRSIVKKINWDCEQKIKFNNTNLGCKINVIESIDWFFSNVEEGIILEDDCVPSESFFYFCEELLSKYKNNEKIMQINGFNSGLNSYLDTDDSYYFSKLNTTWGWATWRRAWQKFDYNLESYIEFKQKGKIKEFYKDKGISKWMEKYLDKTFNKEDNIWSINWAFSILKNSGLCITPNINLIENIGFDKQSTSGKTEIFNEWQETKSFEIQSITHPREIEHNLKLDRLVFNIIKKIDPRASKFYYLINLTKKIFKKIFI